MADQVVLSGFQRYFCMLYTTSLSRSANGLMLFYQDFKDTFVCNTQPGVIFFNSLPSCFIRISKILLYAIHNVSAVLPRAEPVVLSGFQRYFCMQYTTISALVRCSTVLCYQDFNERFDCKSTKKIGNMQIYSNIFCYFKKKLYPCSNKFEGYTQ